MLQLFLGILLLVSPIFAQYDQIWADMEPVNGLLSTTQIGLFFRQMMRPEPDPSVDTAVTRMDFKFYWIDAYMDPERIADGLYSFFDGVKDEIIDENDLVAMMNIADKNGDFHIDRTEFDTYMELAYDYAGSQRLLPGGSVHGHGHHQQHQHANLHHNNLHLHHGKPFFG